MSRALRRTVGVAAIVVTVGLGAGPAGGSVAPDVVPVEVRRTGRVVEGGQAAMVRVGTNCMPGWQVLEAFVTLSQDGGSSQIGFFGIACDGVARVYPVGVPAWEDDPFHPGKATASVYVLLYNEESGETAIGDALEEVRLLA